jgi:SAM-dependent methyltransferase
VAETGVSKGFRPRPQVDIDHYSATDYNTKERICSYWHQVDEVRRLGGRTVLEIGPGAGIVTDWLRRAGKDVTTLDMDPAVGADHQASATDLPLENHSVDVVLCAQVLEHMPFEEAERALAELARVARLGVVVSVPDATPWAGIAYPLWFPGWYLDEARARIPAGRINLLRALARRELPLREWVFLRLVPARWSLGGRTLEWRPRVPAGDWRPEPGSQHFWEVGSEDHPLERLAEAIERAELELVRTYRVPENPWHRFVVARPP